MSDEFDQLENGDLTQQEDQELTEEETPEQIMDKIKKILMEKFKDAGIEKYDYTSKLTGIRIYYDGQKVEITHNGKDAIDILTTNSFVNTAFSNFIQAKVSELERIAYERKKRLSRQSRRKM